MRPDGLLKCLEKISHVDDLLLQFADAQTLNGKVGFARKEQLVVCSKGGQ